MGQVAGSVRVAIRLDVLRRALLIQAIEALDRLEVIVNRRGRSSASLSVGGCAGVVDCDVVRLTEPLRNFTNGAINAAECDLPSAARIVDASVEGVLCNGTQSHLKTPSVQKSNIKYEFRNDSIVKLNKIAD